jgi:hypothetical protein
MPEHREFVDGVTWYCVEFANNADQESPNLELFTENLVEARTARDRGAETYPFWWMSERGEYQSGQTTKVDWMYFSWSPNTSWGVSYGRGTGIASQSESYRAREYTPCGPENL